MTIFFNFSATLSHLHSLQVENCDSNSRLVVDGDDNGKFRIERVKAMKYFCINLAEQTCFSKFQIIRNVLVSALFEYVYSHYKRHNFKWVEISINHYTGFMYQSKQKKSPMAPA